MGGVRDEELTFDLFREMAEDPNGLEDPITVTAGTALHEKLWICIADRFDVAWIPLFLAPQVHELLGRAIEAAKAVEK